MDLSEPQKVDRSIYNLHLLYSILHSKKTIGNGEGGGGG